MGRCVWGELETISGRCTEIRETWWGILSTCWFTRGIYIRQIRSFSSYSPQFIVLGSFLTQNHVYILVYVVLTIIEILNILVSFFRATRPCTARIRLLRLINTQNDALRAPPPIAASLLLFYRVSFETNFDSKQPKLEPKIVSALSKTKCLFRLFRILYRNSGLRCFDWTETNKRPTETVW
jgi:hypothetical protein